MLSTRSALVLACLLLFFCPTSASAQQPLTLGVPVDGALSGTGDQEYYEVSVAAGLHLTIIVDAAVYNSNSYELYIKYGALPTPTHYDDKSDSPNADQAVEIPSTQAGTYYILLRSAAGGGSYTIVAHDGQTFPTLADGTPRPGALQSTYDCKLYQVTVAADQDLVIILDGASNYNHYDLYLRFCALPTTLIYDAKGTGLYADQRIEVDPTQAGTYYLMIRSASGGGVYTLRASLVRCRKPGGQR